MDSSRPVYLNLFKIKFPLTAIVSILHRITGVLLFLSIPGSLYILQFSLKSEDKFLLLSKYFQTDCCQLLWLLLLSTIIYHLLAGIRHIIMDFGLGESKEAAKISSLLVIISTVFFVLGMGYTIYG